MEITFGMLMLAGWGCLLVVGTAVCFELARRAAADRPGDEA